MKSGDVEMQCDYAQIISSSILIWHICVTLSLFTSCYVYFSCPTTVIFSCKFTGFVREISLSWIKTKKREAWTGWSLKTSQLYINFRVLPPEVSRLIGQIVLVHTWCKEFFSWFPFWQIKDLQLVKTSCFQLSHSRTQRTTDCTE